MTSQLNHNSVGEMSRGYRARCCLAVAGLVIFCASSAYAEKTAKLNPKETLEQNPENIEQQVKTLTENYLTLSENLSQVIKEKELFAIENGQLNEKLESAIQTISELTIENQAFKNKINEFESHTAGAPDAAQQKKIKLLEDKVRQLQVKLQEILSLMPENPVDEK